MQTLTFWLNGREITIEHPSTDTMLIDYLRSPEVGLSGPKKPCGQGGCGGCTVILSDWDERKSEPRHRAINSCLHPLVALNGLVVTTVEGTGSTKPAAPRNLSHVIVGHRSAMPAEDGAPPAVAQAQSIAAEKHDHRVRIAAAAPRDSAAPDRSHDEEAPDRGMNPVAYRLALNNGSQCGYCSVGFVMNMSDFFAHNPHATQREIEEAMDGNLCRCTGYRPILQGMKTFSPEWATDGKHVMTCRLDPGSAVQLPSDVVAIPFPPAARATPRPLSLEDGGRPWLAPASLDELLRIMREHDPATTFLTFANTGYGIYPAEYDHARTRVDLRFVAELTEPPHMLEDGVLRVPAGTCYTDLIDVLARAEPTPPRPGQDPETTRFGAVRFMARRTAGRIVRNAASPGGNTMLVLKHIGAGTGAPFPSDALTALAAVGAEIEYVETEGKAPVRSGVAELVDRVVKDPGLAHRLVIIAYHLPRGGPDDVVLAQKVALREVNSHSLVNATTRFTVADDLKVREAELVFGGIAPYPWHARGVAKMMTGRTLSLEAFPALANRLIREVEKEQARWSRRRAELPYDGLSPSYQVQLAVSMLYKAIVNALEARGAPLPPTVESAGRITWGRWRVTEGQQWYEAQDWKAPVAQPYIKLTAMDQASGQIHYTQETAVSPRTVEGVFVQSRRALANFTLGLPGKPPRGAGDGLAALRAHLAERFPGAFVALVAWDSFKKQGINLQGFGGDQPIYAESQVNYVGQSIALAVARTFADATRIAEYVETECVHYTPVKPQRGQPAWWSKPVLSIDHAIQVGSIFPDYPKAVPFVAHVWKITRPGSQLQWVEERDPLDRQTRVRTAAVDGVPCTVVESTQTVGGQKHFYMETQAAIVAPADGDRFDAVLSTQSPMEMHQAIAMTLGVRYNQISVRVPSVGGAFGGKTTMSTFVTAAAAVAAQSTGLPVRVAVSRERDTAMFGKRHPYYAQWQIAIDRGEAEPARKGIIRGLVNRMWGDGGAFYDCSFVVSDCIITRSDNAYRIDNWQAQIDVCRTNTAPSTAFRAFGDIQSKIMFESAMEDAAFSIGMRPEEVRGLNLYQQGDVTPFGQSQPYCYMKEVWEYLKEKCEYEARLAEVRKYNEANRWRKRGLAMIPVKYASGYNLAMLEQCAAVASVYSSDGTVVIHQGGAEMGQGLLTQAQQVAAYVLNLPLDHIDVRNPTTAVIPNPSSTGASTGTTYSAEGAKRVCEQLRKRMTEFGYQLLKDNGDVWCRQQGVDFWNYGVEGWSKRLPPAAGSATGKLVWQNLVSQAYSQRVSLVAAITEALPGGEAPATGLTFKPPHLQPVLPGYETVTGSGETVNQFLGFTYSAACSVVEVDILTGESKVLRSDLVYDIGWSLNPALDVGQVEGAFVQGIGYLTSEQLVVEPSGPDAGRLNTLNTWEYKIPSTTSIPLEFNVHLFPRSQAGKIPENPYERPFSSKEVGEPPLVLSATVFFAIKDAIRASRIERGLDPLFTLDAPATVQEVSRACEVRESDLG